MPPQLIVLLVTAGLQYGPEFITAIAAILQNPNATVQDVENAFKALKPYAAYGIPDKVTPVTSGTNTPAGNIG